jgi:hypothetical protein
VNFSWFPNLGWAGVDELAVAADELARPVDQHPLAGILVGNI